MCLVRGTKLELRTNIVDISRDENISFRCRIDSSHQIEETEAFHFSVKQQDTSKTKVSYKSELPQPRMAQWGWGGGGGAVGNTGMMRVGRRVEARAVRATTSTLGRKYNCGRKQASNKDIYTRGW